jgi:uncharacterized protein YcaQ
MMRQYREMPESATHRTWLAANDEFRRYILDLLATSGPLPGEAIEDRAAVGWVSTGCTEQWWVHRDVLARLDEEWVPRTTLLSPFDNLICDRDRTERLWGFAYRNEMYVRKATRQFGST